MFFWLNLVGLHADLQNVAVKGARNGLSIIIIQLLSAACRPLSLPPFPVTSPVVINEGIKAWKYNLRKGKV